MSILSGPIIAYDLRTKLNRLTHEVDYLMQYWIHTLNMDFAENKSGLMRYGAALDTFNQDKLYTGYRFCRDGVNELARDHPDTWFFH